MRKKGWILLLVLLGVAFLMSCGKDMEPDEAKGELVKNSFVILVSFFFELKNRLVLYRLQK